MAIGGENIESKSTMKGVGNILGIISIVLPSIVFIFILNWFFKLTHFQKLQGMPLLVAPIAGAIGFVLALASARMKVDRLSKLGIATNAVIFTLPFIYWILGTLIFGV